MGVRSGIKLKNIGILLIFMLVFTGAVFFANADEPLLKTDKTEYTVGEEIIVTAYGEGKDWVGIYEYGDSIPATPSICWYYVDAEAYASGDEVDITNAPYVNRHDLIDFPPGDYTVILFANDGYNIIESIEITISEEVAPQKTPGPEILNPPSQVTFEATGSFNGSGEGILTIKKGEGIEPQEYIAYWGNASGKLNEYTAFPVIKCSGNETVYNMVENTLIPQGADRIIVYSQNGKTISEKYAFTMLPEGAASYDFGTPLYELQVMSDIHINIHGSHTHNINFTAALEDIKKISPNSIGIFINGDIADHAMAEEYKTLQDILKNAGDIPDVYYAVGNHDLDGEYSKCLDNFLKFTEMGGDKPYYDRWINGMHFIFLGSEASGLNAELSDAQLTWLQNKLKEKRNPNKPIFLFLHQGIIDTVAGTKAYQKWHGVNQQDKLSAILKGYPEVIMFSGHSHWEMQSEDTMKERDEKLPTIFNTSSVAYLWNDAGKSIFGSEGYYIKGYEDKVLVLGRDFVNGKWVSSAQYIVEYPQDPNYPGHEDVKEDNNSKMPVNTIIILCISFTVIVIGGIIVFIVIKKKKFRSGTDK